jgi:hypothetical protein
MHVRHLTASTRRTTRSRLRMGFIPARLSDKWLQRGVETMVKISVFYPNGNDTKFDMEYYCKRHTPSPESPARRCRLAFVLLLAPASRHCTARKRRKKFCVELNTEDCQSIVGSRRSVMPDRLRAIATVPKHTIKSVAIGATFK